MTDVHLCPKCSRRMLVLFISVECEYCTRLKNMPRAWVVLIDAERTTLRNDDYVRLRTFSKREEAEEDAGDYSDGVVTEVYAHRSDASVALYRYQPASSCEDHAWLVNPADCEPRKL